jgi:hypothetical protein
MKREGKTLEGDGYVYGLNDDGVMGSLSFLHLVRTVCFTCEAYHNQVVLKSIKCN